MLKLAKASLGRLMKHDKRREEECSQVFDNLSDDATPHREGSKQLLRLKVLLIKNGKGTDVRKSWGATSAGVRSWEHSPTRERSILWANSPWQKSTGGLYE